MGIVKNSIEAEGHIVRALGHISDVIGEYLLNMWCDLSTIKESGLTDDLLEQIEHLRQTLMEWASEALPWVQNLSTHLAYGLEEPGQAETELAYLLYEFTNKFSCPFERDANNITSVWSEPIDDTMEMVSQFCHQFEDAAVKLRWVALPPEPGDAKRSAPRTVKTKRRRAQERMIGLLNKGKLPLTLRQAAASLSDQYGYNTVRDAAHRSITLRSHFGLSDDSGESSHDPGELLNELTGTMARNFEHLSEEVRQTVELEWKQGDKQKAIDLAKTLTQNPDAGWIGDVSLIDDADQDRKKG